MSLDVTPLIPAGRQVIQSYQGGVFRISDIEYTSPIIVLPDRTFAWPVTTFDALAFADFEPVLDTDPPTGILLLGCGGEMRLVSPQLRGELRQGGIVVETMDTGAACRTFNVLMSEDRRVAAALLPAP